MLFVGTQVRTVGQSREASEKLRRRCGICQRCHLGGTWPAEEEVGKALLGGECSWFLMVGSPAQEMDFTSGKIRKAPEKTLIRGGSCAPGSTAALFTKANAWKQPKCPSAEMDKDVSLARPRDVWGKFKEQDEVQRSGRRLGRQEGNGRAL